jgi:hypothetical protein
MRIFKNRVSLIIAVSCVAYLFSGCAKAPDEELAKAKAAIKAAQDVEADKYMARNFQNVQKALETAESEIANQQNKFVLTRKYKRITEMLVKTEQLATEIANEAPKVKADMVAQVKENIGLTEGMLKETANDIKKAKRAHDKSVITELQTYLDAADSAATHASADFASGNILGASEYLEEFQMMINKITGTLKPKSEEK